MNILIVHPSRGRPEEAYKTYLNWLFNSNPKNKITYCLSLDGDDKTLNEYIDKFRNLDVEIKIHTNNNIVEAVNRFYYKDILDSHKFIVSTSDDMRCPKNWDTELKKVADRYGYHKLIKVNGVGMLEDLICMLPMGGTEFFIEYGSFYHPEYQSMYCDCDITEYSIYFDLLLTAQDLLFPHLNPKNVELFGYKNIDGFEMFEKDDTYVRETTSGKWDHGINILNNRRKNNFELYRSTCFCSGKLKKFDETFNICEICGSLTKEKSLYES